MIEREVDVRVGEVVRLENGIEVTAQIPDPIPHVSNPSEKAIHESYHINADPEAVEGATVVSTAEFDAATFMNRYSRKAFGASKDLSGNGHDMSVLRAMGDNEEVAAMEARIALAGKDRHIHAVASALDNERNISGDRARQIIQQVYQGETAVIHIKRPDGKIHTERRTGLKSRELTISGDLVEDEWLDLDEAA